MTNARQTSGAPSDEHANNIGGRAVILAGALCAGLGGTVLLWQALQRQEQFHKVDTALPEFALVLGMALSVLLALAVHLAQRGAQRARSLEAVNCTLASEIAQRQRVAEEQARLIAILEATPDFVGIADSTGKILYYNAGARHMLGLSGDADISQHRIGGSHTKASAELILNEGIAVAAREDYWRGEAALVAADGHEIPVSQLILAHKSPDGRVHHYSTVCRDISQQNRAEAELRRADRALKMLAQCTQAVIHARDEAALLKTVCKLIIDVGGYRFTWVGFAERDENKTVRPVVHAGHEDGYLKNANIVWADVERGRGPTGRCIRSGRPVAARFIETNAPYNSWREEGLKRGYLASIGLPLAANGAVFGALTIYSAERDAFDAAELELLAQLAGDLACGITALRIRANRKRYTAELERSNRDLQDFASIASHDLQEPLRKIRAFGDRLKAHCGPQLDETGSDFVARMENAAARMSTLIERLLKFSRVSTRAQPFEPVELSAVTQEVLADMEARIQETHAEVRAGAMPAVIADRLQLRELLQNLIANALKFHRPGESPVVQIEAIQDQQGTSIIVRDNGIGFDEKYLARIFLPFQRLHSRIEFEGCGMGLAICRKIVRRHGGELTAHSQPGKGSEFVVRLPATPKPEEIPWSTQGSQSVSCWPKTTICSPHKHFLKRAS